MNNYLSTFIVNIIITDIFILEVFPSLAPWTRLRVTHTFRMVNSTTGSTLEDGLQVEWENYFGVFTYFTNKSFGFADFARNYMGFPKSKQLVHWNC